MGLRGIAEGPALVLGGRSEIGLEVARRLAPGWVVILAALRSRELVEESATVTAAGATAVHSSSSTPTSYRVCTARRAARVDPPDPAPLFFAMRLLPQAIWRRMPR